MTEPNQNQKPAKKPVHKGNKLNILNADARIKKIKINIVLADIDLSLQTEGSQVQVIAFDDNNVKIVAPVNAKSYRKVQSTLREAIANGTRENFILLLTGDLDLLTRSIASAGIVAQEKSPAAPSAQTSTQSEDKPDTPTQSALSASGDVQITNNVPTANTVATEKLQTSDESSADKTPRSPTVIYKKTRTVAHEQAA